MPRDNCPILVGGGQITQRDIDPVEALGPIDLMVAAAEAAREDAQAPRALWERIDTARMVQFLSGKYDDPAGLLCSRLGIGAAERTISDTGGNTPQALVNRTAEDLSKGRCRAALLVGGEVLSSMVAALRAGLTPKWAERDGAQAIPNLVDYSGSADHETPYGFRHPANVYPLFENAYRAHRGWSIEEHQQRLGELFSPFTRVAATNPYAWFRGERSADEITTEGPRNRYVGWPYTKLMNAMILVDQAAALIMTTVGEANRLGIPEHRWVYLRGCADAQDHWFVTERDRLFESPAIRRAGREALEMAQCTIDEIDYIDLYSCFPSAVQISRDELGVGADSPRPLTVTGGLPYFGGPANNYVMHSIATMMDMVRAKPGSKGLCSAIGWYITKHAIGVYSTEPFEGEWRRKDPASCQRDIDALPKAEVAIEADGPATIETYTVLHGRETAERGIIVGRLEDGKRFVAQTPNDPAVYSRMMSEECVGATGKVRFDGALNQFDF